MKYLVAVLCLAFASMSMAAANINLSHHNNSVKGDVKSNIKNSNLNSNYNKNSNYSKSNSNSNAYSHSSNKTKVDVDASSRSKSKSKANSSAYTGDNSVNVTGDTYDLPANSVPVSIGGICTDAAAAQGNSLGVSISRANPVCEKLKMMEVYKSLGMQKEANEALKNAETLSDLRAFFRGTLTILTLGIL